MVIYRLRGMRASISDDQIIDLYWARDEKAIEETDLKYRRYLLTVAGNIVSGRLDCEECLNDTYLGAWNAIPPAKPNNLKAFLTTIIRRTAINRYHSNQRKTVVASEMTVSLSELEDFLTDSKGADTELDARELGRVLSDFVRSLPPRRRFIFISRYYMAFPIDAIARDLNLSRSMINKELAALRGLLKERLKGEGYIV